MNDRNHVSKNALMHNLTTVVDYATRKADDRSIQLLHMAVARAKILLTREGDISWPVRCFLLDLADSGIPSRIEFDIRLNLASTKMLFAKDAHPGDADYLEECSKEGCREACQNAMIDESVVSAEVGGMTIALRSKNAELWIHKKTFLDLRWEDGPLLVNGIDFTRLANGWAIENASTGAKVFIDWSTYQGIEGDVVAKSLPLDG